MPKTILLIDDEQTFLEPLADALEYKGYRVLKARTAEDGLDILSREPVDLVTIDIMLDPGNSLSDVQSQHTGIFLCEQIREKYPLLDAFCISVVSDKKTIDKIRSLGIRFLRKGETPLRTVLNMMQSMLTGIAYSTERDKD
ncbi:MAG: response regulator [Candidatus Margulisiibacteriota bacterium]